jgi:hypothetical protein
MCTGREREAELRAPSPNGATTAPRRSRRVLKEHDAMLAAASKQTPPFPYAPSRPAGLRSFKLITCSPPPTPPSKLRSPFLSPSGRLLVDRLFSSFVRPLRSRPPQTPS